MGRPEEEEGRKRTGLKRAEGQLGNGGSLPSIGSGQQVVAEGQWMMMELELEIGGRSNKISGLSKDGSWLNLQEENLLAPSPSPIRLRGQIKLQN